MELVPYQVQQPIDAQRWGWIAYVYLASIERGKYAFAANQRATILTQRLLTLG